MLSPFVAPGTSGRVTRPISLCVVKSTMAKPWKSESCTKIRVVAGPLDRNRLRLRHRRRVDDVDGARRLRNRDVDAPAVLRNRHVVRMSTERNMARDLQRLRIDDVERTLRLIGHIESAAVGRSRGAMVRLDILDLADDLVGRGIDQRDAV